MLYFISIYSKIKKKFLFYFVFYMCIGFLVDKLFVFYFLGKINLYFYVILWKKVSFMKKDIFNDKIYL